MALWLFYCQDISRRNISNYLAYREGTFQEPGVNPMNDLGENKGVYEMFRNKKTLRNHGWDCSLILLSLSCPLEDTVDALLWHTWKSFRCPLAGDDDPRGRVRKSRLDRIWAGRPLREDRYPGPRRQWDGQVAGQEGWREHHVGERAQEGVFSGFKTPLLASKANALKN